jgi:hypothetical protein
MYKKLDAFVLLTYATILSVYLFLDEIENSAFSDVRNGMTHNQCIPVPSLGSQTIASSSWFKLWRWSFSTADQSVVIMQTCPTMQHSRNVVLYYRNEIAAQTTSRGIFDCMGSLLFKTKYLNRTASVGRVLGINNVRQVEDSMGRIIGFVYRNKKLLATEYLFNDAAGRLVATSVCGFLEKHELSCLELSHPLCDLRLSGSILIQDTLRNKPPKSNDICNILFHQSLVIILLSTLFATSYFLTRVVQYLRQRNHRNRRYFGVYGNIVY